MKKWEIFWWLLRGIFGIVALGLLGMAVLAAYLGGELIALGGVLCIAAIVGGVALRGRFRLAYAALYFLCLMVCVRLSVSWFGFALAVECLKPGMTHREVVVTLSPWIAPTRFSGDQAPMEFLHFDGEFSELELVMTFNAGRLTGKSVYTD